MDTAAPKPDDLISSEGLDQQSAAALQRPPQLSEQFLRDLWRKSDAEACSLTLEEFKSVLATVGKKHNYGLPPGIEAGTRQIETFFGSLHIGELALAHACARSREAAWERFLRRYRDFLTQTAIAITGSSSLGPDIADSLYAELYGLRERDGERRSPLASYSGRGSLQGWLRTTLVQRFRDHYRHAHREGPLDEFDLAAPEATPPEAMKPGLLVQAVAKILRDLSAEDRFLLSTYFLDHQTLMQIARTLHVHEATVSRRLARLLKDVRKQLIDALQQGGLSKRAAEEALGTDPRDLEINLHTVLQTSQLAPFSDKAVNAAPSDAR